MELKNLYRVKFNTPNLARLNAGDIVSRVYLHDPEYTVIYSTNKESKNSTSWFITSTNLEEITLSSLERVIYGV